MTRRRSFPVMGTVATVTTPDAAIDTITATARAILEDADARFSPYRHDSELSRLRRHPGRELSADLRTVRDRCAELEQATAGAFRPLDPTGRWDPTGYVKGWAMAQVERALRSSGHPDWMLGVGGDVVTAGGPDAQRPWHVAVQHPVLPGAVAEVLAAHDGAVATSGDYERGAHVWGKHRRVRGGSVTVVGPDIAVADALATALWSHGEPDPAWWARFPAYGALWLDETGGRRAA